MPAPSVPCRLFVILARESPTALILRRGPSRWVQLIRWDTLHDTFEPGAWFHGRIYEKRCDLSPDGTKFVYFAARFNARTLQDQEYTYAWSAVSKLPWLTALALWPKGDCWHGGGLFETNNRLWLNHDPSRAIPHPKHQPQGLTVVPNPEAYGEDEPVYLRRLERDGWTLRQEQQVRYEERESTRRIREIALDQSLTDEERMERLLERDWEDKLNLEDGDTLRDGFVTDVPGIHEKRHPEAEVSLVMTSILTGFTPRQEFTLRDERSDPVTPVEGVPLDGAIQADFDHSGRLIFVRAGKLFAVSAHEFPKGEVRELADFNGAQPERTKSPDWARMW